MRTSVFAGLLCLSSPALFAQTRTPTAPVVHVVDEMLGKTEGIRYYDKYWEPLPSGPTGAYCYDHFLRKDSANVNWQARRYVIATGQLILEQFFTGLVPGAELEGHSREWYETGQLREELTYHKSRVGALRTFHPNGQPHRTEYYTIKGSNSCLDSTGRALAKCPPYHTFAQMKGKNTYSGKFLKQVQHEYTSLLPKGYTQPKEIPVFYAFRIDSTGVVRDARVLTEAPVALQEAITKAIYQLPAFTPATLEGKATDDVVEGLVEAKPTFR